MMLYKRTKAAANDDLLKFKAARLLYLWVYSMLGNWMLPWTTALFCTMVTG